MESTVTLHVVPHSHWDREWYRPFQSFRLRLVELVDMVLDLMESEPAWTHFMLDGQTATAMDYLEVRPGATERLRALVRDGRIAVGPWHILMDEFLVSGETTIRNLQLGQSLAAELGASMPVGYLPDMFGHISQMPQILRLAGFDDAVVWRGVPEAVDRTAFLWEAPDGSSVRTIYLATSYSNGAGLPTDPDELPVRTAKVLSDLQPFRPGRNALAMCGTDHLFPTAGLPKAIAAAANGVRYELAGLADFVAADRAEKPAADLPRWQGELRSGARANLLMGVVSNRVDLRRLVARAENELERYAEPLQALVAPHLAPGLLDIAWRKLIENSAHDTVCACSVDEVTEQGKVRWNEALQIAEGVSERALRHLSRSVAAPAGPAVAVFNPGSQPRAGVVDVEVEIPPEWHGLRAVDATTAAVGAVVELDRTEPVAVDTELPAALVPRALAMVQGRRVGEEWVNGLEIPVVGDDRIEAVFRIDAVPKGEFDVDAAIARARQLAETHPHAIVRVRALRPARRRLLIEVPEAPGLGWTTLRIEEGDAPPALAPAPAIDVVLPRVVDGGDVGDTYNYCWPLSDDLTDAVTTISDDIVEDNALRRRRRVVADHAALGRIEWHVTATAGSAVVSIDMSWVNTKQDHRVRLHLALPRPATESRAGGPFSIDTRGLTAEGGPTEVGIPTFPARDLLEAGGLTVLLPQVTEYELVDGGRELALTALRCTGTISRGPMASRPLPAGPDIATPLAQCPGPQQFGFGLVLEGSSIDHVDDYHAPLRGVVVHDRADGSLPARQAGPGVSPGVALSSCRQLAAGGLEVRVWNPAAVAVAAGVAGGHKVDLRGEALEDSGTLRPQEIATYRL